jgi:ribosomal protein S18 acetylase RimI-like enzyme
MSDVVVRRARAEDLPHVATLAGALVRLHHEVDPERFFLPDDVERGYAWWLGREIARDEAVVLVAEKDGAIVGYAYGAREGRDWNMLLDDHGAIHDVFVAEHARRGGVASALMRAMIEALGGARIVLHTMVDNHAAQALFRACGFRPTMVEMTRDIVRGAAT